MKLFTTMIDENLHKKLKEICVKKDKKIIELIEEAVLDLIEKYGALK